MLKPRKKHSREQPILFCRSRHFFLSATILLITSLSASQAYAAENYLRMITSDSTVKNGDVITVFIESSNGLKDVRVTCFDKNFQLYRIWHKTYKNVFRGFLPVPALQRSGSYRAVATVLDVNDETMTIYSSISVRDARFISQKVALPKQKKKLMNAEGLEKESISIVPALRENDPKVYFSSFFIKPVAGRISSGFGRKRIYNTGQIASYHKGIDIVANRGTPIKASNGGRVSLAESMESNGNIVLINHGHGVSTIYSHLDKILVKEGDWVKRGHIVGKVGSTGISTGPHLHFGVSVNDVRVNPTPWIKNEITLYLKSD